MDYTPEEIEASFGGPPITAPEPVKPSEITGKVTDAVDFELYEGPQPGIHSADIWFGGRPPGERGTLFLRATDVMWDKRLSPDTVEATTMTEVESPPSGFAYYPGRGDLGERGEDNVKIYEGDFGDPYAVRFDLVHRSDDDLDRPIVLLTKTYLIEGWEH